MNQRVGIILATFRPRWDFFIQQIESIRSQSHKDWFCVIVDDSVDDIVAQQIQTFVRQDARFKFVPNSKNLGPFCNFIQASQLIPGCDFVAFSDQDDIWLPNKLELILREFEKRPEVNLIHSDLALIDSESREFCPSCWRFESRDVLHLSIQSLLFRNVVTGCSSVFRKSLVPLLKSMQAPGAPILYYHDQWVSILALLEGQILSLPQVLVKYRQHSANLVGAQRRSYRYSLLKIVDLHHLKMRALFQLESRRRLVEHLGFAVHEGLDKGLFKDPEKVQKIIAELDFFHGFRWVLFFLKYGPRGIVGVKLFILLLLGSALKLFSLHMDPEPQS